MKVLKILVNDVIPAINKVASVVSTKSSLPILECILFETSENGDNLTLTSSDGNMWLKVNVPIVSAESGIKFCVEAKQIKQALGSLAGREVTIDVSDSSINCYYDNGQFNLPTQDPETFPYNYHVNGDVKQIEISSSKLLEAAAATSFATSVDELKLIITGVHFDFSENTMKVAATDTIKLAMYSDDCITNGSGCFGFTISKKTTNVLQGLVVDGDSVKIGLDDSRISFSNSTFSLESRLIEGEYPNYGSVIPRNNNKKAVVRKDEFLAAIKRVVPFGETATKMVIMSFSDGILEITGEDVAFGTFAKERIPCEYTGDSLRICFSGTDLTNCVGNIVGEKITITLNEAYTPIVIAPTDGGKYMSLLMPMSLKS